MKTIDLIKIFCITALCFILSTCGKTQDPSEDLPMASQDSGIYLDGVRICKLESAFCTNIGAPDYIIYCYNHWEFFENPSIDYPSHLTPRIHISGKTYWKTTYTDVCKKMDRIQISGGSQIEDLDISLNNGEYEAESHPDVMSVTFNKYSITRVNGRYNGENDQYYETADIDIRIILNNGKIIDIIYDGPLPWSGLI